MNISLSIRLFLSGITIVAFTQPVQAMESRSQSNTAAWLGLLGTTIGAVGSYYGYQYYKQQKKSDALMAKANAELQKGVPAHIGQFLVKRTQIQTYQDRIKLIPAITKVRKNIVDDLLLTTIKKNRERCTLLKNDEEYQTLKHALEEANSKNNREKAIALYACIVSPQEDNSIVVDPDIDDDTDNDTDDDNTETIPNNAGGFIDLLQEQQAQNGTLLLFKNEIPPHTLFGRPLLPGEVAFVGYSDGDLQIMLEKGDLKTLNSLTEEEREYLLKLYTSPTRQAAMTATVIPQSEWNKLERIFADSHKKTCIENHYGISVASDPGMRWRKQALLITTASILYLGGMGLLIAKNPTFGFQMFKRILTRPSFKTITYYHYPVRS